MKKNSVELCVKVNGRPVDEYKHKGKIYIEGRAGSQFEISVRNDSSFRKKFVLSVDGLNIMTGDRNWDRGYVIEPWQSVSIPGWRVNGNSAAKFFFTKVGKSYNQHNDAGDKNNIGVIGLMVFEEQPVVSFPNYVYHYHNHYQQPSWFTLTGINSIPAGTTVPPVNNIVYDGHLVNLSNGHSVNLSGSAVAMAASATLTGTPTDQNVSHTWNDGLTRSVEKTPEVKQSVGTGWGKEIEFKTTTVTFEAKKDPAETLLVYYDSLKGLKDRGVNLNYKKKYHPQPNAFPGYRDGCPPPK